MKRVKFVVLGLAIIALAFGITFAVIKANQPTSPVEVVTGSSAPQEPIKPTLSVKKVIDGLSNPWEVAFLPSDTMLFNERSGQISKLTGTKKTELLTPADVVAQGEGGMLGLTVDPKFQTNRYVFACFNSSLSGDVDVRVARWTLSEDETTLANRTDIVTGMPANQSGRHSGCRIGFGPDDRLWIGTGDAADETQPQNQSTLGGKILRVTRGGEPAPGNQDGPDPRVFSYGHRNTQGLAFYDKQAEDGSYGISVEHGTDRDDEVNSLLPGNFGYAPGVGYDESVAMTDSVKFPSAVKSIWSSGNPAIAPSDAEFLSGKQWGDWQGWLAMAVLKDKHLRLLKFENGKTAKQVEVLNDTYGRLRAVTRGPSNSLYVTTDNGTNDVIYRIELSSSQD